MMADVKEKAHDFFLADAERLAAYLERVNFGAYADLLQHPLRLMWVNWLGGVFRGLGIGIGFTVIAGLMVLALQQLEILNLPVIGKYIAELVTIVQGQLHVRSY